MKKRNYLKSCNITFKIQHKTTDMTKHTIKEFNIHIDETFDIEEPKMWHVIFVNDDFTPMDFVIDVLIGLFGHSQETATELMLQVHHNGQAVAGTYVWEIAETKADQTTMLAISKEYPLKVVVKPA